jgi:hypothetical protein
MSKAEDSVNDGMRAEYDFSGGVRGKYAERFTDGCNVIVLDPDLAGKFPTAESVNKALRVYLKKRADEEGAA